MRISSSMIYDFGVRAINDQMTRMVHTQQTLATGRRILTPADDPVEAARALVVTETKNINTQFATNQRNAKGALELEETQLSSIGDILARIRELTVQGGNTTLTASDRTSIAMELRARFEELMGVANSTDGNGDYIFSGYMGTTKPFGGNVDGLLAASGNEVAYMGDEGQRRLQVSPTRFLEVSDSGNDLFRRVRNGNGYFVTDFSTSNMGTAIIDAGNVTNPAVWDNLASKNYKIQFWVDTNGLAGTPGDTYYDIVDTQNTLPDGTPNPNFGNSLVTGAAAAAPTATTFPTGLRKYHENQSILLRSQAGDPALALATPQPFDLGSSVIINGTPAEGDSFTLTPSTTQSLFKTLANVIGALEGQTSGALFGPLGTSPNWAGVNAGGSFDLTVDGVTQNISIPAGAYDTNSLATAINNAIIQVFGSPAATASVVSGGIRITSGSTGVSSSVTAANAAPVTFLQDIFGTATPTSAQVLRSQTAIPNEIGFALTNFDRALETVLRVRAAIGSRLSELDSLDNVNQDTDLRLQETLSRLQDVDYAKSISELQFSQNNLDAAQKSFMKVSQMSLFNYL